MILPEARTHAPVLVVTDMPAGGASEGKLFDEAGQRLLKAILKALGVTGEQVSYAPLAIRRPPGGLLDDALLDVLGQRLGAYLNHAQPKTALILGDRANRALSAMHGAGNEDHLRFIHLQGGNVPTVAIPSPRPIVTPTAGQSSQLARASGTLPER